MSKSKVPSIQDIERRQREIDAEAERVRQQQVQEASQYVISQKDKFDCLPSFFAESIEKHGKLGLRVLINIYLDDDWFGRSSECELQMSASERLVMTYLKEFENQGWKITVFRGYDWYHHSVNIDITSDALNRIVNRYHKCCIRVVFDNK
jgi:hypothetical protein